MGSAAKAETDWAAERILRKEAVKLDFRYDFDLARGEGAEGTRLKLSSAEASSSILVSVRLGSSKGWSSIQSSPIDVDRFLWRLSGLARRMCNDAGVASSLLELTDSLSVSRDGIDSVESDRADDLGPNLICIPNVSLSSSRSSGGLRSIPQDWGLEEEIVRLCMSRSPAFSILRQLEADTSRRGLD